MPDFEVIFMDAGQGDCTLIAYPDKSLTLVDCGSTKGSSGADGAFTGIRSVLEQYFNRNNGVLDNLVLTHPDEDHYNQLYKLKFTDLKWMHAYYGGDIELYKNARENDATHGLLQAMAEGGSAWVPPVTCDPDPMLSRAGVQVTVLAANCTGNPASSSGKIKNSNSIVLLVEYMGAKIFLMGDAFVRTEDWIIDTFTKAGKLNRLKKGANDHVVLKLGHHGSDTSTSANWVKLITPQVLVASSGTKTFKGKGMPTVVHLDATVKLCTSLESTDIEQSYVLFDESQRGQLGKDFITRPKTKQAIWTTCYQADWDASKVSYFESGQAWYYGVGLDSKKRVDRWYGYTGYET